MPKKSCLNTDTYDPDFDIKIWIVSVCTQEGEGGGIIAMITQVTVINSCVCRRFHMFELIDNIYFES